MGIHHVSLELRAEDAGPEVAFWALLGLAEVPLPPSVGDDRSRWVERAGTQVHLMFTDAPGGTIRLATTPVSSRAAARAVSRAASSACIFVATAETAVRPTRSSMMSAGSPTASSTVADPLSWPGRRRRVTRAPC